MSKSIEELYREQKEKAQSKPLKKSDKGVVYEKISPPERWYEKHWGIWLLLILCFPLGVILLCSSRKYSSGSKIGIVLAMMCLILYAPAAFHDSHEDKKTSTRRQETNYSESSSSYDIGYLNSGAKWVDNSGVAHRNSKRTKVEIWKQQIVTADGGRATQIYFLEGEYSGSFGFTSGSSLSR